MITKTSSLGLLTAAVLSVFVSEADAAGYTVLQLQVPDADAVAAFRINNAGQVVGTAELVVARNQYRDPIAWSWHALLWNGATLTDLGIGRAFGINDAGQAVGMDNNGSDLNVRVWSEGTYRDLSRGWGWDINNSGQIAGASGNTPDFGHATIWNGNTKTVLGPLHSVARAINNAGQVVGWGPGSNGRQHATMWNGATGTDLGSLGVDSAAWDINNSGQVVGYSGIIESNGNYTIHATLWQGTTPIDLGQGQAVAINNKGQVVGSSPTGATLWNGGVSIDLNSFLDPSLVRAGWVLVNAVDINDHGAILAEAKIPGQFEPWVVLTPIDELYVVNNLVNFNVVPGTAKLARDLVGCAGFAKKYRFSALLTNSSYTSTPKTLTNLAMQVRKLSGGNKLFLDGSATPGTLIGEGEHTALPLAGGYADGQLAPRENEAVSVNVCLTKVAPFQLLVDVLGKTQLLQ